MDSEFNFGEEVVEIEATNKTPYIKLDRIKGDIEISGISIPENTKEFYWNFNRWLTEYSVDPAPNTKVEIKLMYMNSSSTVVITRMLMLLDELIGLKTIVQIDWYYESDDLEMKEIGQYYNDTMKCTINLHEVDKL
jgi:SiaC family regulatory phosphoprotein